MLISGVMFTHHLPEEALPWIVEARNVFDELVIFIDEKRVTPDTIDRAKSVATRVLYNKADTWWGADGASLISACKSDWVFGLDYDEQLSPEWQQDGWRQILETTPFTHFWCARRWIVPGRRYINYDPWWPDSQLRLFRNNLEGTRFPAKLHDTIRVPGPDACFQNLAVHHHVLWLLSRAQREEKARYYEQLRPSEGLSHYYLYEDYAPPEAALPKPAKLDVNREIIRMEKLPPEKISKISLEVTPAPGDVRVSALFWLDAQVTNATNETLYPVAPCPVRLAYHWIEKTTRQMVVFDSNRSGLFPSLYPDATGRYPMTIVAPNQPGEYILQTTMVQDGVCWFEDIRPDIVQEFAVSVIAGTHHNTVSSSREAALEVVVPYLALSTDEANGYCDGFSLQAPVRIDETQVIRFENIESLCPAPGGRLRINPLYGPAFLKISRIVITRNSDGLVLYGAEDACEFDKIDVSDGFTKWVADGELWLTATDAQQYFYLPALDLPPNESYRLEIKIEPESAPPISQGETRARRGRTRHGKMGQTCI